MSPMQLTQNRLQPAEEALSICRDAYYRGDYSTSILQSSRALALGGDDPLLVATVCYVRGNIEESRGRDGLALRIWASGLQQLRGMPAEPLRALLARSIDDLLARPRVVLSHARSASAQARRLRLELARQGVRCLDHGGDPGGFPEGCESVSEGLDLATAVMLLWSRGFSDGACCEAELTAALERTRAWAEIGPAPRLVVLRLDETPLPPVLAGLEVVDLRHGLDAAALYRLAVAARGRADDGTAAAARRPAAEC